MPNYKLNTEKKIIIIDDNNITSVEKDDVAMYVAAGYTIKHKSEKRSAAAKGRAETLTKESILKALKANTEAKETFENICKGKGTGKGFFAAKKWYKEYLEANKQLHSRRTAAVFFRLYQYQNKP